jgi:hypothetical protein
VDFVIHGRYSIIGLGGRRSLFLLLSRLVFLHAIQAKPRLEFPTIKMGVQSIFDALKEKTAIASPIAPGHTGTVINDGNLDYTEEIGGNDSKPSYQGNSLFCTHIAHPKVPLEQSTSLLTS